MIEYHIDLFYSGDDGGYIANIPDLEYCSAFGETPQKALNELMIAYELWVESARENGLNMPSVTYKPQYLQSAW